MNVQKLTELNACHKAVKWAKKQKNPQQAWDNCERGDWMLWLICKTIAGKSMSDKRKHLVLAACDCTELALKYVVGGEDRPRKTIEIIRKWAKGDNSISERDLRNVAAAAYATYAAYAADADADAAAYAAAAAAAAAAAYAADAAAYAAAAYAAYAAYAAADADAAAADADAAAYAAAAKYETLKQCANIVRKYYPNPPIQ